MRVKYFLLICLLLSGFLVKGDVPEECKTKILETYAKGKFLVLKVGGIPTMVEKLPGDLGSKSYCWVVVKLNGEWKVKRFLGQKSDSTNVLEAKELLIISKIKVSKKSVSIFTRTDRAMPYDASGRESFLGSSKAKGTGHHANKFVFTIDKNWGCPEITAAIEKYFDAFSSRAELNKPKEIKLGMTIEEVEKMLGQPLKKAILGAKTKYKYEDMKITFEDGKVVDVDF